MNNSLCFYDYAAWTLAVLMEIWMVWKLRDRRKSMFEIFLMYNVGKSFCLWLILQTGQVAAYCGAYIWFSGAGALIEMLVMIELINGLRTSAAIPTKTFRCFLLYSLSLMGMLICLTFFNDRTQGMPVYVLSERLISLAELAMFVTVVGFSAAWGMAWRRESGIIAGFGLIALIELTVSCCHSNSFLANSILARIQVFGQLLGMVAWAKAIGADCAFTKELHFAEVSIEKLAEVMVRLRIGHLALPSRRIA